MLDIIIVEDNREKGLNMGVDDYIEKSFDLDILLAKIRGISKRKKTMNIILSLIKQSIISC